MAKNLLWAVYIIVTLNSCRNKKDLSAPAEQYYNFFPLNTGDFQIYEVEDKSYTAGILTDSAYYLKINYPSTWINAEGKPGFITHRSKKYADTGLYVLKEVWSTSADQNSVIATENNTSYLKLLNPLFENKTWNGNQYNHSGTENYKAVNLGKPFGSYPFTVTIIHRNDTTLLSRDYRLEVYALETGLIYKEVRKLSYSPNAKDFGKGIIVDGVILKQWLIHQGNE